MSSIFVSYNRQSEQAARALADDLHALGHTPWLDQELSGGQAWWDRILARVRDCDAFVFVLDSAALRSTACQREYGYADALGKPVLPVLVADDVSTNLLPPALSAIQFVDYRAQDREAAFRLARALGALPAAEPLPDPLPEPPAVPISYLGSLTEKVALSSTLSFEEQSALVHDLRRGLRDPELAADARALLAELRTRRDLLATIAEEIDELLRSETPAREATAVAAPEAAQRESPPPRASRPPPPAAAQPTPVAPRATPGIRERARCARNLALVGAAAGAAWSGLVEMGLGGWFSTERLMALAITAAAGGGVAGLVSGARIERTLAALLGIGVAVAVCTLDHVFFGVGWGLWFGTLVLAPPIAALAGRGFGAAGELARAGVPSGAERARAARNLGLIGGAVGVLWVGAFVMLLSGWLDLPLMVAFAIVSALGGALAGALAGGRSERTVGAYVGLGVAVAIGTFNQVFLGGGNIFTLCLFLIAPPIAVLVTGRIPALRPVT